jgi:hypothetical protein
MKDDVTLEETVTAPGMFQKEAVNNNLRSLPSFSNVNKGRKKANKCDLKI